LKTGVRLDRGSFAEHKCVRKSTCAGCLIPPHRACLATSPICPPLAKRRQSQVSIDAYRYDPDYPRLGGHCVYFYPRLGWIHLRNCGRRLKNLTVEKVPERRSGLETESLTLLQSLRAWALNNRKAPRLALAERRWNHSSCLLSPILG